MSEIVLTTLNARYIHASFGLRYLKANLAELSERAEILEFVIGERPLEVVERVLASKPRIVGIGVYIWNVAQSLEVVQILKEVSPETTVVLGGPEISYGGHDQGLEALADYIVCGEADIAFRDLCRKLLSGDTSSPRLITPSPPEFGELALPYELYDAEDIAHRIIYVEASRGCPFKCEFCLSSLDVAVRKPDLARFLDAMAELLERGVRHFKFVDRTFNLNLRISRTILEFFLERYQEGMFLHFEMVPDRLPAGLKDLIGEFPAGSLQFEVGIQTFDPGVAERIQRRQDIEKVGENLAFLKDHTGVHVHADLIVGLPGEGMESFGQGFDALVAMGPQEIQVGILKLLKGTPIARHNEEFGMRYSPTPPFEILQTAALSFAELQSMRRFARLWDLFANSGNFHSSLPVLWATGSPFVAFSAFAEFVHKRLKKTHGISLSRLAEVLFDYRHEVQGVPANEAGQDILADFQWAGRREIPHFLRAHLPMDCFKERSLRSKPRPSLIPPRQARHLGQQSP